MTVSVEELRKRFRYEPDTGHIFWRTGIRAPRRAFTYIGKRGYAVTTFRSWRSAKRITLSAHRTAWALHYCEHPTGNIDHINGDRVDNRIANLRDVVSAENARNVAVGSNNSSGVIGVYRHSQMPKWTAQINAFGKTVGLGCFTRFEDAVIARKAAERVLGYHPNHGRK